MYVNVVFVIACLYSAVSLTLVRERRFIKNIIIILFWICSNKNLNCFSYKIKTTLKGRGTCYDFFRRITSVAKVVPFVLGSQIPTRGLKAVEVING